MAKINLLPKSVAELIAAGEVVERPASVIKELVENAIDAFSTQITVEIQRGGITYIRITDNGIGIDALDVPTAFLRHATSKIKVGSDLDGIATLGFRGEALAAVSAVSRLEMLTCTADSNEGTHYVIEGGGEILNEPAGCPKGTTVIIRDIFYNTPARMKFLKKDVSEGNACAAVIERIALSHPEIAFKFIRDGKQVLTTSGNGDLKACVYSVLGREFASSLIEVRDEINGVKAWGLTCKPFACKATRSGQYTFLNGRLVRSGTVIAAVEQAYKNSVMVGKFPAFVLYLEIPFDTVDVNVHPAKTEVRFSDERRIFDAVYAAVKNAITQSDTRPEIKINKPAFNPFERMSADEYHRQTVFSGIPAEKPPSVLEAKRNFDFMNNYSTVGKSGEKIPPKPPIAAAPPEKATDSKAEDKKPYAEQIKNEETEIVIIGEAFSTYIIAQKGDSIFMIDKHAAHERIIFNQLKAETQTNIQALLTPVTVKLSGSEYDGIINNLDLLFNSGFEIEDFGNSTVIVRGLPSFLTNENVSNLLCEIAEGLIKTGRVSAWREDELYHTVACRAAIKAGNSISRFEMLDLAQRVLCNKEIMYCPHGRPVAFEIKKRELEKQFGRIQ